MFCIKVFSLQFTAAARLTPDANEITRDYLWIVFVVKFSAKNRSGVYVTQYNVSLISHGALQPANPHSRLKGKCSHGFVYVF